MTYLLRRLAFYLVAAFVAITLNFFIPRAVPGNPAEIILSKYPDLTAQAYKALEQMIGGAVGTGSVRGMPHLLRLRAAGFSVWPFDPASPWTVMEIYPRLLTGPVHKRSRADRVRYLESVRWSVPETFGPSLAGSEDAFDAGISALVLSDHLSDLAALRQTCDPVTLLEGDVWRPPKINA